MGRGGTFWCLYHCSASNRRHDVAQAEHFRIDADPACVRDFIENHYTAGLRQRMFALVRQNPAWGRQSGEARSAYIKRMRALHAPLLGSVKRLETRSADG